MAKNMTIFIFLFAIYAVIDASCNGIDTIQDSYFVGYNATCGYANMTGCKIGQQKYGESAYDIAAGLLGGYLSLVASSTAGFACGLCDSGFLGNTTQEAGKKAQSDCQNSDGVPKCCPNNGPQCGNSPFQQAYKDVQPGSCIFGYEVGTQQYEQASLTTVGAYFGIVFCLTQGILACSSISQTIGGGILDQSVANLAANVANILGK